MKYMIIVPSHYILVGGIYYVATGKLTQALIPASAVMNIGVHVSLKLEFCLVYAQEWDCWIISQLCFYIFEEPPY